MLVCSECPFPSLTPAFHILNNTTIQFKLEKIPIERESELTFSLSPDDLGTSSIMKIEGKFVNPVQVSTLLIFMSRQLKSHIYFIFMLYAFVFCYVCKLFKEISLMRVTNDNLFHGINMSF